MKEKTFALLIDVDNLPLTADSVHSLINQVKAKGDIAYGKIYGLNDKKHKGMMEIINKTGFDFTARSKSKKSAKSVIDNRMLIDAVEIACINENIDSICLVAGDGDLVPLFAKLKELGMYIVGGFNENPDNADMCHEIVYLDGKSGGFARPTPSAPRQSRPQQQRQGSSQSMLSLRERLAQRNAVSPLTRIEGVSDVDKAAQAAGDKHQDMFNEIDRMVQDFIKETEN